MNVTHVRVHPSIREIKAGSFSGCSELATVRLGDGLEIIGEGAFHKWTSLERIAIPPTVEVIDDTAFLG